MFSRGLKSKTICSEFLKKTKQLFFPFPGIFILCALLVFLLEDKKMMERMYAPQKSEFYKLMLFVSFPSS